ncbi:hypothetical protein SNEBB_003932 [Seison nebaliae]|nr:hypothetical protein SNEBB_003932 [Seison nebaliae]
MEEKDMNVTQSIKRPTRCNEGYLAIHEILSNNGLLKNQHNKCQSYNLPLIYHFARVLSIKEKLPVTPLSFRKRKIILENNKLNLSLNEILGHRVVTSFQVDSVRVIYEILKTMCKKNGVHTLNIDSRCNYKFLRSTISQFLIPMKSANLFKRVTEQTCQNILVTPEDMASIRDAESKFYMYQTSVPLGSDIGWDVNHKLIWASTYRIIGTMLRVGMKLYKSDDSDRADPEIVDAAKDYFHHNIRPR